MKLFQRLLVAPAALGLMAPVAATAAALNINDVSSYSDSVESVKSLSQFSDVYPTDWAYQALSNMLDRHGCPAVTGNGAMTRYEAAALLNKCLGKVAQVNTEERRLVNEFSAELAVIKGRLDGVEANAGGMHHSGMGHVGHGARTMIMGKTAFVVGGAEDDGNVSRAVTFNYDTKLAIKTSFNGKDLLKTVVRTGNFNNADTFGMMGPVRLETAFNSSNALNLHRAYYQFPVGNNFNATVGPRLRQDDLLGVWPSAYPNDSILNIFTYAGANAAYSKEMGAGAGVTYAKDNLSASLLWVGDEASTSDAASGGIGTEAGSDDITAQLAWVGEGFTLAAAYTVSDGGRDDSAAASNDDFEAWGLSGVYEFDSDKGILPSSISAGFGWKTVDKEDDDGADGIQNNSDDVEDTQTWSVGLLWDGVGGEGNSLGIAMGTAEGHRDDSGYDDPMAYEIFYSMAVTDSITVTPALFIVEKDGEANDDYTGGVVKTTFSF